MSRPRLALLDATHGDEHTSRNFRRELEASIAEFPVTEGQLPAEEEYDGVVISGSRSSVYWDEPWIAATSTWVRDAVDRGLPVLGICWGHQLLADALGGTVEGMGEYEIGYNRIRHDGTSRLFSGVPTEFVSYTSHEDAVVELPPGARALAHNEYSNHGFRRGRAFGVQFHPEYDTATARDLVERKDLSPSRRQAVLAELTAENQRAARPSALVFENFLAFVDEVRTGTDSSPPQVE